jgi:hypothetical protein
MVAVSIDDEGALVDCLIAVPGMIDSVFRQQLYEFLPAAVREQLPRPSVLRHEVIAVVRTLTDFRHLGAWEALMSGLRVLVPKHPSVDAVGAVLARANLTVQGEV